MSKHVIEDAKRCLQCKTPRCQMGCPVNTPIRDVIHLLLDNKVAEAGSMLFENNPLSLVCTHVCPQENQCEGNCVLNKTGSPVQISAIEQYISDFYLNIFHPVKSTREKGRVAIIGSGPAGITIAFLLAEKNYDVTIFEGNDRLGGVLRYGIPEFRLPKRILDLLAEKLVECGVKIRPNTTIGANINIDDLQRDGYKAIFIGTGVWRANKLALPGESLGNVHYAIDYLRNPEVYELGRTVVIIGAGNVAMDVARTVLRHGTEDVTLVNRLGEEDIAARPIEVEYSLIDGAKMLYYHSPVEFTDDGVILIKNSEEADENGEKNANPVPGTETFISADSTIIAVGQGPRAVIVSSTKGIDIQDNGLVAVDEFGRTTREGVFASGDVVTGAKTVVEAVRVSRRVADAMDEYIQSLGNA